MSKKKNKKKKRLDQDVRPIMFFKNYDYADDSTGPGKGLFHGPMGQYKSIEEFLEKSRKRKKSLNKILEGILEKISSDTKK